MTTEDENDWGPLFVGSVIGGRTPGNTGIATAIDRLSQIVDGVGWTDHGDESGVDVVFHVAGPLLATEFTGVRTGRYARPVRLVAVQIAVPAELENRPPEEVLPMLADDLVEATELAAATLAKRRNALPVRLAVDVARRAREVART
ncbi:hypothetical protein [Actinoplanes sp. NPDC049118]|uniref:hypothetical protein n=1 Tax=Actinoplanes sp. NPDC049118 TaxID=3155769 RepID=UPI0033FE463D